MTPPTARTWARRGHTPVIRVRGRTTRCLSVAALACYKTGERSRLVYRPRRHSSRKGARKSFAWTDYRDLLCAAHKQLGAPIVLVWDNLGTHVCKEMREFIDGQDWFTVCQLPAYAPELNPVEGVWALLRRGFTANVAFTSPDHLIRTVRHGLRKVQYCPALLDGCLAETRLSHVPEPRATTPQVEAQ
ncbi:transposase [Streptomyces sp. NPDC049577]|uniref:transposase n=1 Tax=Streptomyces sp. NPDC049577 TaxID=3155153 RepID=UPI003435028D